MDWVTILLAMVASACLTLAIVHVLIWWHQRTAWANVLFSVAAASTGAFAYFELLIMHATSVAAFAEAMRWGHVPVWILTMALAGFVRVYLGAGRAWLIWAICLLRTLSLVADFTTGVNLNYREITELRLIPFLGQLVPIPVGTPNPWQLIGQLSILLLIVFIIDSMITAARGAERSKVLRIGGALTFFVSAALLEVLLVFWGFIKAPIVFSPFFLGLLAAMGYELSRDAIRAAQLASDLRESEHRMNLAVEAAGIGIWTRDIARGRTWASSKLRELFGTDTTEELTPQRLLECVHPEDRGRVAHTLTEAMAAGGPYQMEFRLVDDAQRERWVITHGRVELDQKRRAVLVRSASMDLTATKDAERDGRQLRDQIAHVGRVAMMGQLSSALAHEINQPLGAILRNVEAAEMFLDAPLPDMREIRTILADIHADDMRAGAVIDRMRAMLRQHELKVEDVDVTQLIRDVVALAATDARSRRVSVDVEAPDEPWLVKADPVQIQQVLLNLLMNAMDAIDTVPGADRRVVVRVEPPHGKMITIAVIDNGSGVPADVIGRVFDPFFTTKTEGLGMGLAISRTIAEAHGGTLRAENNERVGATFRLMLPTARIRDDHA